MAWDIDCALTTCEEARELVLAVCRETPEASAEIDNELRENIIQLREILPEGNVLRFGDQTAETLVGLCKSLEAKLGDIFDGLMNIFDEQLTLSSLQQQTELRLLFG